MWRDRWGATPRPARGTTWRTATQTTWHQHTLGMRHMKSSQARRTPPNHTQPHARGDAGIGGGWAANARHSMTCRWNKKAATLASTVEIESCERSGDVACGVAWSGIVAFGVAGSGDVACGVAGSGIVAFGVAWSGVARCGVAWYSGVWYRVGGIVWCEMGWDGMDWDGIVRDRKGS